MRQRHFAGPNTRMLLEHLREHAGPDAVVRTLRRAEETRSAEVLGKDVTWSSYSQFRRLLEAAAVELGGSGELARIGAVAEMVAGDTPNTTETLQAQGSPRDAYASLAGAGHDLAPVVDMRTEEVGASEWLVTHRFREGFEPFEAYCSFAAGLLAMPTRLFGLPPAEVVEEECRCRGASRCRFRVRWEDVDESVRVIEYLETRNRLLEARLESLHRTVSDLVSGDTLDVVLPRIVASSARAIRAPSYVLVVQPVATSESAVYADGLDEDEAHRIAEELIATGSALREESCLAVEVASTQRSYGWLAAIDPKGDGFYPQERVMIDAYARVAAAALDSAAAVDEARRQVATTQAMLDLSIDLSTLTTAEEMAETIAQVAPRVIACDRVVVSLFEEPDGSRSRVAGTHGYPPDVDAALRARTIDAIGRDWSAIGHTFHQATTDEPSVADIMAFTGSSAVVTVPILWEGTQLGAISAVVTHGPDRLRRDAADIERLAGLAGQAATAIQNSRLLEQMRHQALHDALTDLPNRELILDRTEQLLARTRRHDLTPAALFLDLDGFKEVNDTLGHEAGDELLRMAAVRLAAMVRDEDTIGRLGGDEFVVLTEGSVGEDAAEQVGERLLGVLREPFVLSGSISPIAITGSIGAAIGDRLSAGELLRDADIALYEAKGAGKDRLAIFRPVMRRAVSERMTQGTDLRVALRGEQFCCVYQPVVDLTTGVVTGVEALLRWHHPTRGMVEPDGFLAVIEQTPTIAPLGRWTLTEACRQGATLHAAGHRIEVSVNVFGGHLATEDFVGDLREVLVATGFDAASLVIEVSEAVLARSTSATVRRLRAVREMGVRVALDDLGARYSPLAEIRDVPVDAVKVHRSFIDGMDEAARPAAPVGPAALLHALLEFGKALGLATCATGVEEAGQVERLRDEQCDLGQGHLFAGPVAAHELADLLRHGQPVGVGAAPD